MTKYCPKCGTPNEDDSLYCAKCGSKLIYGSKSQKLNQKEHKSYQYITIKKSKKRIMISAITIITIIIIIFVAIEVINYSNNNVNVTAVNFTYTYYSSSGTIPPLTSTHTQSGFEASTGSYEIYILIFNETIVAPYMLTINSITSSTPGFQITSASPSLPYTITYGAASISITIKLPNNSYTGVLGIYVTGTVGD